MRRFLRDRAGATAIEYALVAAIVSIVIVGGVATIGQHVRAAFFDNVSAGFTSAR
ncbi:MAG: Flp/Fap pilin component [Enterovirga sp.]|jgi:pilus assembly protein Flp/PilA|nr:Flp/Fap pilin component [Enterovirga sp.]